MLHGLDHLKIGKIQRKHIQIREEDKLFLVFLLSSHKYKYNALKLATGFLSYKVSTCSIFNVAFLSFLLQRTIKF